MENENNKATENQETNTNSDGGNSGGGNQNNSEGKANENKPMSFDDFLKQPGMQAEFDKRLGKGIDTAVSKESARLKTVFDQQLDEQARMAKMTDAERTSYLDSKRQSELAEREAEITRRELAAEAKDSLTSKGLPIELADILTYTDKDACDKSLEKVEKAFTVAVQAAVDERLKGKNPPKDAESEGDKGSVSDVDKAKAEAAKIAGVKL